MQLLSRYSVQHTKKTFLPVHILYMQNRTEQAFLRQHVFSDPSLVDEIKTLR